MMRRWWCHDIVHVAELLLILVAHGSAFVAVPNSYSAEHPAEIRSFPSHRPLSSSPDGTGSGDPEMKNLLASLKSRQAELNDTAMAKAARLRRPKVSSRVAVVLADWVRRIAVDDYPWIACGSASSRIYLANLETGEILGQATTAVDDDDELSSKSAMINEGRLEHVMHQLYGQFDGGGTLAIGISGDLICSASRKGGLTLYRWIRSDTGADSGSFSSKTTPNLIFAQGTLARDHLVTTIQFTSDSLIVGTDTGSILLYELEDLPLKTTPSKLWKLESSIITSLAIHEEIGLIAAATDSGRIHLVSLETDLPLASFTPPYDGTERRAQNAFPTSVTFVECSNAPPVVGNQQSDKDDTARFAVQDRSIAVVCGCNDGSLYLKYLAFDGTDVDYESPFFGEENDEGVVFTLMPRHFASVKCLTSPGRDLLMSGGLDGTLRVWDVKERRFLYQFMGYKVWLGSLWTDGIHLCSDGSDNTIILHQFLPGGSNS
jgi:hypothetical protein